MSNSPFLKPTYDGRCFTAIPRSIAALLTAQDAPALAPELLAGCASRYAAVVLLLVDGFGWRFFERFAEDYPVLRRAEAARKAFKLSAQFPSTTAAHVTCLHTGLEVGQSGVYEWQYYEPQLDAVITPLLFSYAGTKERDQLKATGVPAERLYPTQTIYGRLQQAGITSLVFQVRDYTPSTFSDVMLRGAQVFAFRTLSELLVNLRECLDRVSPPAYCVVYFDQLDTICHDYGPGSPQFEAEVDTFLTVLERQFFGRSVFWGKKVLLMITADHGQVEVYPTRTTYLNIRLDLAPLLRYLRTDRQGRVLVPAGSARDAFLYVQDEALDEVQALLAKRLAGRAEVRRVADLIAGGYFGAQPPAPVFMERVGNLVVLPYAGEAVWWYEKDRFEQRFYGHHGGLTPQEMEIPLLLYELG